MDARIKFALIAGLGSLGSMLAAPAAQAVPSFAAQTGQPCTACHIGGFGPQLTPLGFDERFRRLWEYYLSYCEAGFRSGTIDVRQMVFAKP